LVGAVRASPAPYEDEWVWRSAYKKKSCSCLSSFFYNHFHCGLSSSLLQPLHHPRRGLPSMGFF